jgi:SpoVK/Ycf46/Vps4 family AAA+-type ATPase
MANLVGDGAKIISEIFEQANQYDKSIIFFDEIDAIASSREGDDSRHTKEQLTTLLTNMDGFTSAAKPGQIRIVIAATNRPESLDEALLRAGRFDTKIYIPLPDKASIKELLKGTLDPVPYDADLDLLAEKLDGYTCADIVAIANKAKEVYVKRQIIQGEDAAQKISTEDVLDIISRVKSSVSEEERRRYEAMKTFESVL